MTCYVIMIPKPQNYVKVSGKIGKDWNGRSVHEVRINNACPFYCFQMYINGEKCYVSFPDDNVPFVVPINNEPRLIVPILSNFTLCRDDGTNKGVFLIMLTRDRKSCYINIVTMLFHNIAE